MASIVKFPLKLGIARLRSLGLLALVVVSTAAVSLVAPVAMGEIVEPVEAAATPGAKPALVTRTENFSAAELKRARTLDWVPLEELTDQQKEKVPSACCGAYIAPERTDADANLAPDTASLRASALDSQAEQGSQIRMKGKVMITQGNRSISAEDAEMNQDTRQAELNGNIQLREPGFLFRADKASLNMDSGDAQLDNTRFVLYETRVHGEADHLQKFGDNIINLDQSTISSCEPGDNSWSIQGTAITLHPDENYGTAKNMRINIKDVPMFYMPYARFPLGSERLTGFLFPSIGPAQSPTGIGADMSVPFYWNIAPNYDATITPRYMSGRGPVFELDTRHMSELFDSELHSSIINNDQGGYSTRLEEEIKSGDLEEEEAYPYRGYDRWFYHFTQQGGHDQAWSSEINYSDVSDRDYLRDMSNGAVDSNRQAYIRQMAAVDYRTENWLAGVKVDEYRLLTIRQLPYRELPRVYVNGNYRFNDAPGEDWVLQLNNEYVDFVKNRNYDFNTAVSSDAYLQTIYGERFSTDYRLIWDKTVPWGFFKPGIAAKSLGYQLDEDNLNATADSSPAFVVPQATLDTGLIFERSTHLFGDDYRQTFEPRAFYFYSAYRNQDELFNLTSRANNPLDFGNSNLNFNYNQLFRTTRFSGGDRLDDANQISLAVSTAFVSQGTDIERLRVSLGQIYYANDRRVSIYSDEYVDAQGKTVIDERLIEANTRSTSALALQITGQVGKNLRFNTDAAYDQREGEIDNISVGLHYMDERYRLFNIAYRYSQQPQVASVMQLGYLPEESLNQIDTSILWPINNRWSVVARTNYDFHYGVELDTFAGFEYNDCCYRARIMWRRWLNFDYSPNFLEDVNSNDYERRPYPFIELELKGLGNMSQRISSLLDKAIAGFSEREKNLR